MNRFGNIMAWILAVLLALLFLNAGGVKLIGAPAMIQEFAQIGIGQWFRYVTGILEVVGAIGLLIPKYRFWAALLIACIMACATVINIVIFHKPQLAGLTFILMALAFALALLRRPKTSALRPNPAGLS